MIGGVTPETCWASYKYGIIKILVHCCILLDFSLRSLQTVTLLTTKEMPRFRPDFATFKIHIILIDLFIMFSWPCKVIYPYSKNENDALFTFNFFYLQHAPLQIIILHAYFQFISIINLYVFRGGLLLIICI